jgi:hypothetical protein
VCARRSWTSKAYDHFNVSVNRDSASNFLSLRFTCIHALPSCEPINRTRHELGQGTSFLQRRAENCDKASGRSASKSHLAVTPTHQPYSEAAHRAILAMRCATSHRPLNMVKDPLYKAVVELLRPGTKIPDPTTLRNDLPLLTQEYSKRVK